MLRFLLLIVSVAAFTTGCSLGKTNDTKPPASQVGIIDMNQAIKAHPRYGEAAKLEQQYNTLAAQVQASRPAPQVNTAGPDMSKVIAGINAALEQEFNAKMTEKQAQLSAGFQAKVEQLRSDLTAELQAYAKELDQTYQSQIFSIQLKLKTVHLSQEEMTLLQDELDKLQKERAAKLAAKEQELSAKMDEQMAPEKAAIEQQLAAYAQQLHAELAQKGAAQAAEIANRNQQSAAKITAQPAGSSEQQLAAKQREIEMLKQLIVDDIRSKAAKVAVEQGLEAVLAKVQVNVNAVDITGAVISQFSANNIQLK